MIYFEIKVPFVILLLAMVYSQQRWPRGQLFFFCRSFFLLRSFVKIVSIVYPDQISISYGECFVCWCMTGLIDGHFQVVITQFNVYNVHRRCIDNGPCIIKEMVPLFVPYERWLFKLASEPVPMFITLETVVEKFSSIMEIIHLILLYNKKWWLYSIQN